MLEYQRLMSRAIGELESSSDFSMCCSIVPTEETPRCRTPRQNCARRERGPGARRDRLRDRFVGGYVDVLCRNNKMAPQILARQTNTALAAKRGMNAVVVITVYRAASIRVREPLIRIYGLL
jgi:hypothetical protein